MRRSQWGIVGLAVLAVVAIALALAALRTTRGTGEPPAPASALPNPTSSATSSGADLGGGTAPPLLMVSPTLAYRAQSGTCSGGSELQRSTDGGVRWQEVAAPATVIESMSSVGGDALDVVGADRSCDLRVWTSTDRGGTWVGPGAASEVFARVPEQPGRLSTPTGVMAAPCSEPTTAVVSVVSLSAVDGVVLCASGEVQVSNDGGATWVQQQPVGDGRALAFVSPQQGWALRADTGDCPAYQVVQTQDAGLTWQDAGCVGGARSLDDDRLPALSFADASNGMADLAGKVYLTTDGGRTWNPAE